ncbi:subtilase-type protease inhibitor [Streptomyces flavofungini]|uniref:subtilase-type protease inhibitor n=1 Tax=Streptomyces flavofungini TaxID=68200 RepID=UPI0025AFC86C|nr:subtilase-type protease inhibitor [Streptomyces flavofungini]WJV50307.1 subtilase-type protease inhibitor [Streptomyces flavofungini]
MRSLTVASAALLALAAGAVTAVPSAALSTDGTPPGEHAVFLTVSGDANTWIRGVLLSCAPEPSGYHPFAKEACADLDRVGGDFDALPREYRICTKEYAPVTVGATGTFQGRPVDWRKTYGNACEMEASTGYVFRF